MPKLTHPDITSLSIEGVTYDADKKGHFDIPDAHAAIACADFGFTAVGRKKAQQSEEAEAPAQPAGEEATAADAAEPAAAGDAAEQPSAAE